MTDGRSWPIAFYCFSLEIVNSCLRGWHVTLLLNTEIKTTRLRMLQWVAPESTAGDTSPQSSKIASRVYLDRPVCTQFGQGLTMFPSPNIDFTRPAVKSNVRKPSLSFTLAKHQRSNLAGVWFDPLYALVKNPAGSFVITGCFPWWQNWQFRIRHLRDVIRGVLFKPNVRYTHVCTRSFNGAHHSGKLCQVCRWK